MADPRTNPISFLQEFRRKYNATPFHTYFEASHEFAIGNLGVLHFCKCNFAEYTVTRVSVEKERAKFAAARAMIDFLEEKQYFDKFGLFLNSIGDLDLNKEPKYAKRNPFSVLERYCSKLQMNGPSYLERTRKNSEFVFECIVGDSFTIGKGTSKQCARWQAATEMCGVLSIPFDDCKNEILNSTISSKENSNSTNSVNILNELCGFLKQPMPTYEPTITINVSWPSYLEANLQLTYHKYIIVCRVGKRFVGKGAGPTNESAMILAAKNVLLLMATSELAAHILEYVVEQIKRWPQASKLSLMAFCYCYSLKYETHKRYSSKKKEYMYEINVGSVTGKGIGATKGLAKSRAAKRAVQIFLQDHFPVSKLKKDQNMVGMIETNPVKPLAGKII